MNDAIRKAFEKLDKLHGLIWSDYAHNYVFEAGDKPNNPDDAWRILSEVRARWEGYKSGVHSQLHEIITREKIIGNLKLQKNELVDNIGRLKMDREKVTEQMTAQYLINEDLRNDIRLLKSALQQIADMPDALYKSDAVKMRTIARDAVKS